MRLFTYCALCIALGSGFLSPKTVFGSDSVQTSSAMHAQKLAAEVRDVSRTNPEAAYAIFFTMLAPKVVLHHVPATHTEGEVDSTYISNGARREDLMAHRAMPDFQVELKDVEATGNAVKVLRFWRGTGIDGQPISVPVQVKFELRGSQIVAITAAWDGDPKQQERLEATLKARGGDGS
jgi:hypothetical protein